MSNAEFEYYGLVHILGNKTIGGLFDLYFKRRYRARWTLEDRFESVQRVLDMHGIDVAFATADSDTLVCTVRDGTSTSRVKITANGTTLPDGDFELRTPAHTLWAYRDWTHDVERASQVAGFRAEPQDSMLF